MTTAVLRRDVIVLFLFLVAVYHLDGTIAISTDIAPNVALPANVLHNGDLTFTPETFPSLFPWLLDDGESKSLVTIDTWETKLSGVPAAVRLEHDQLSQPGHYYYLVRSKIDGVFVNRYGLGAGLTALPLFAVLDATLDDFAPHQARSFHAGKLVAASCVAGSAVLILLIASMYLRRVPAALVALTYGLGTGVWSTSSQGLWQHGPNELFLASGCYFLLRSREGNGFAASCGLSSALAVVCRPTSAVFVAVTGLHLLRVDLRRFAAFAAAGLPIALLVAFYNHTFLGEFWQFAQSLEVSHYALRKTGAAGTWQFDALASGAGLLFSPSRGLLVFSPVMIFALFGVFLAWRDERFSALRPISVTLCGTLAIQLFWFEWWGGFSYGYRQIVDTMVYLALFLIPAVEKLRGSRMATAVFCVTLAWSVLVQGLGAFASTGLGWNERVVHRLRVDGQVRDHLDLERAQRLVESGEAETIFFGPCSIDAPECRHRLWSVRDSQIAYHLSHFAEERARKIRMSSWD